MSSHADKYLRMSLNERIQHILLFSSFLTLIITGFWLKFPEAWWVAWIKGIIGPNAFAARANIHRTASVIMIAAALYHVFYISFFSRGRQLVKDFWFKKQDALDLVHSLSYLIGKQKDKPKFGRFSYIEKMEYWAVVWGTVIMGMTGGVLWFENTFMNIIRPEGMYVATTIHYYEAILASLAILVWHFYFVFLNPDIKGMNKAWVTGYLTKEEMEEEHPLELDEIEKKKITDSSEAIKKEKESAPEKKSEYLKDLKPVDEKPIEDKPVDERPVDEKPIDEKHADEKPEPNGGIVKKEKIKQKTEGVKPKEELESEVTIKNDNQQK